MERKAFLIRYSDGNGASYALYFSTKTTFPQDLLGFAFIYVLTEYARMHNSPLFREVSKELVDQYHHSEHVWLNTKNIIWVHELDQDALNKMVEKL